MIYWRRAKRTRLHDSMRTISDSWYRASDELQCMHGFGTELIRNLAIWLAVSQDYHLFIYKVYWYILSMFVPIFTSFGIENASLHSGRPRKLLPLISLSYFFLFHDPRVSTRGIASIVNLNSRNKLQWNIKCNSYILIQENAFENVVCEIVSILSLNVLTGSWLVHAHHHAITIVANAF